MNGSELIASLIAITKDLGPVGLVIFFGWLNMRWVDSKLASQREAHERERKEWKAQFTEVMEQYQRHMGESRRMYEDNVTLVKGYERLSCELTGIITLATQTMTELVSLVKNNMFCPQVRKAGPSA